MEGEVPGIAGNYKKVIEMWEQRAINWDYQERYTALGLTGYSEQQLLPIAYYGEQYAINRTTGALSHITGAEVQFETAIAIYSLLYHSEKAPQNSGEWVPFRDVKRAAPFAPAFQRDTLNPFARTFNGKQEQLQTACQKLGFTAIDHSDAGYLAMAFSCMPIQFLFWDGDDEFDAQSNILFDANITDYVHEETVVMIAADGTRRIKEAAGL